ncbi:MAG: serine/threonine protein kinase [Rhodocyclales bacterium]|nr:serine/threonine protein kinase [Rhodocyclales bacterium]
MAYPSFEQYNNAFQAHQQLLSDPELQKGAVAKTGLGTPLAISGGFALTYTIKAASKKYAVRCFHRESKALERRYQAIARRLAQLHSPYFLDFEFQPKGIRVDGNAYPIVKMAWAQGVTLGEFLEDNHGKKGALASLPASLLALSVYLENERVAHGDIQTGNMMVSGATGAIQLIDYDGMFVEDIRDLGSSELGHINFQHPDRKSKNPFGPTMDRFSLIALSLALKALHEDPALWDKTNSEMDAIVFRANDFVDPASSSVFSELMRKPALANHAQHFAAICRAPLDRTPSLEDFLAGKNIPAGVIQISIKPLEGRPKLGYMGVYDVLDATSYAICLRRVGDKVEVIGRIAEVKHDKARNGKPYIFINFGPWQGTIFKISIWSEGLAAIAKKPDASWVGKWVSVIGLMEPPYVSRRYKYSHLSINVTANGQMTVISETEAKFRLTPSSTKGATAPTSNKEALAKIKGGTSPSLPTQAPATSSSANKSVLDNIRRAQVGTQSSPTQTTSQGSWQPQRPRPSYQRPPGKGIIARFFDWLLK